MCTESLSLRHRRTEDVHKAASWPGAFIVSSELERVTTTTSSFLMGSTMISMILMSQCLLSTISAMVLPSQPSQDPDYFLLPSTPVHFEDENSFDRDESEVYPDDFRPTNEEILEALLSQMDYPEESERIYDSLMKREDETLSHQLSYLKESEQDSEQDIDDRKVLDSVLKRRRKRSIPPFVQTKKLRSGMH